ncbi:MAG: extracellular solute-binding protein [Clostridiales bacterium]|nr:extracellular solute-binding protein [Clostridiales bacterium]
MRFKKILILILSVLMLCVTAFAGCKPKDEKDIPAPVDYSNGDPAKKWYVTGGEPLEIKVFFRDRLDFSVEDNNHNTALATLKEIEKRCNVKFKWETTPWDIDLAKQRFTTSIMDKRNACDLYVFSFADLSIYGEKGGLFDYSKYLDTWAPNFKKVIDSNPQYKKDLVALNGGMYIMPTFSAIKNEKMYIIRKDWLDKFDLDIPQTIDDLMNVFQKFSTIPGVRPFVFDNKLNGMNLFESFGVDMGVHAHTGFFLEDGVIKFAPADERVKEFIELAREMYENGYIMPNYENPSTNEGADLLFETGKAGMTFAFGTRIDRYQQKLNLIKGTPNNQNPEVIGILPPAKDANSIAYTRRQLLPVRDSGSAAIHIASKHKLEILRIFDFIYSEEGQMLLNFGIEGEHYILKEGQPVYTEKITKAKHIIDNYDIAAADALRMYGIAIDFPVKQDIRYEMQIASEKVRSIREAYNEIILEPVPNLKFTSYEIEVLGMYLHSLETCYQSWLNGFIKGTRNLSQWNSYIQEINSDKYGLSNVLEIYNEAYQRYINS